MVGYSQSDHGGDVVSSSDNNEEVPLSAAAALCGERAMEARNDLNCVHPIEGGIVRDWEAMGELWDHALFHDDNLGIQDPSDSKILLTEPPMNPKDNRHKIIEHMFETLDFGAVNVSVQSMLVLYAQGLLTGLVVEAGEVRLLSDRIYIIRLDLEFLFSIKIHITSSLHYRKDSIAMTSIIPRGKGLIGHVGHMYLFISLSAWPNLIFRNR